MHAMNDHLNAYILQESVLVKLYFELILNMIGNTTKGVFYYTNLIDPENAADDCLFESLLSIRRG